MKPVYDITLCDPIYSHYSDEVLTNIAIDFLRVFQEANFKRSDFKASPKRRLFSSDKLTGNTCVEARPGKVKIDFSFATIQGWAHSQIFNAETVIEEITQRIKSKGILFNEDIAVALDLGQEIIHFLDKFTIPPALSADDIIYNAQQTCEELRL